MIRTVIRGGHRGAGVITAGRAGDHESYITGRRHLSCHRSRRGDDLIQSPWATTKIKAKPPWKIGYIAFAITSPYNQHVLDGLRAQFAKAKAAGLVTGSLSKKDTYKTVGGCINGFQGAYTYFNVTLWGLPACVSAVSGYLPTRAGSVRRPEMTAGRPRKRSRTARC